MKARSTLPSPERSKKRLRRWLLLFFLALAIPIYILFRYLNNQLQSEALFEYRAASENLVERLDERVRTLIAEEEARSFEDYSFFNVSENALFRGKSVGFSPLSQFPVVASTPGTLGYFQITPGGKLETPTVPSAELIAERPQAIGLGNEELNQRISHQQLLANLLQSDQKQLAGDSLGVLAEEEVVGQAQAPKSLRERFETSVASSFSEQSGKRAAELSAPVALAQKKSEARKQGYFSLFDESKLEGRDSAAAPQPTANRLAAKKPASPSADKPSLEADELALDTLVESKNDAESKPGRSKKAKDKASFGTKRKVIINYAPQADLGRALTGDYDALQRQDDGGTSAPKEQLRKLESQSNDLDDSSEPAIAAKPSDVRRLNKALDIRTFEGEIDPIRVKFLDNDHLVFYRNVWRDKQRFIQGYVVSAESFLNEIIKEEFYASGAGSVVSLAVKLESKLLKTFSPQSTSYRSLSSATSSSYFAQKLDSKRIIYQRSLGRPLGMLVLEFSTDNIQVLSATRYVVTFLAGITGLVLLIGTISIYRFGVGQIDLAKERSDFVSAVSHELKTPLTSIRMYGEMLRSGMVKDAAKQSEYYDFIFFESERLSRLIGNILHLARLTNSSAALELGHYAPQTIVDLARSKVSTQCEAAGFTLGVEIDEIEPNLKLELEEDAMARIFINLVDNALKFSSDAERKEIQIGCRLSNQGKQVEFFVRDFGPGIAKDQMRKIFRLFYRTESELTRKTKGTGIGLALVSELARKMGGQVDVRNCEPGAEFIVRFSV